MLVKLPSPTVMARQIEIRVVRQVDDGLLGREACELHVEGLVLRNVIANASHQVPGVAFLAVPGQVGEHHLCAVDSRLPVNLGEISIVVCC